MEIAIIAAFVVAVILIAVLTTYIFHLKNDVDYWYTKCTKEEKNIEFWREKCEELADINEKSLNIHEDKYIDAIKKIDELVDDNLKKEEAIEELKAKLEAFTDSMNNPKVINLPLFDNDIEELDFPNSHNEED